MLSLTSYLFLCLTLSTQVFSQDVPSSYLPDLLTASKNTTCSDTCSPLQSAVNSCVYENDATDQNLIECSCGSSFLSKLNDCGECVDSLDDNGTGRANYEGWYNKCISLGQQEAVNLITSVEATSSPTNPAPSPPSSVVPISTPSTTPTTSSSPAVTSSVSLNISSSSTLVNTNLTAMLPTSTVFSSDASRRKDVGIVGLFISALGVMYIV